MGSIYYLCPDFSPPSGGTKRLYRHVFHLNRMGFSSFIVHFKKGFVLTWHDYKVPVMWLEDRLFFEEEDVLVFPEGMPSLMKQTKHLKCKRVAIVLSWAYIYGSLPQGDNWRDYGITKAITPSSVIKDFLERSMGIETTLIANYIDGTRYSYQPDKKKNKIAYPLRKDSSGETLRFIFEKKGGVFNAWEWMPLKDLSEEKYSIQLSESKIFLAISCQEGIPTSVLEAMASGCAVVGFSGVGGNEYMIGAGIQQNCFLIENGNLPELAKGLEEIILRWEPGNCFGFIIRNAVETASCFKDLDKEANSLKQFFESLGMIADKATPALV